MPEGLDVTNPEWKKDCMHWRGKVLTGEYAHWCFDWDGLPVDETTNEWDCCTCFKVEPPSDVEWPSNDK